MRTNPTGIRDITGFIRVQIAIKIWYWGYILVSNGVRLQNEIVQKKNAGVVSDVLEFESF